MPTMVAPKRRPVAAATEGAAPGAVAGSALWAGWSGSTKVGGAMPIIVPLKGSEEEPAGVGALGPGMRSVPVPNGAAGNGKPHAVQPACWSRFCAPQRPHCFIDPAL